MYFAISLIIKMLVTTNLITLAFLFVANFVQNGQACASGQFQAALQRLKALGVAPCELPRNGPMWDTLQNLYAKALQLQTYLNFYISGSQKHEFFRFSPEVNPAKKYPRFEFPDGKLTLSCPENPSQSSSFYCSCPSFPYHSRACAWDREEDLKDFQCNISSTTTETATVMGKTPTLLAELDTFSVDVQYSKPLEDNGRKIQNDTKVNLRCKISGHIFGLHHTSTRRLTVYCDHLASCVLLDEKKNHYVSGPEGLKCGRPCPKPTRRENMRYFSHKNLLLADVSEFPPFYKLGLQCDPGETCDMKNATANGQKCVFECRNGFWLNEHSERLHVDQIRCESVYPDYYREPIVDKEELETPLEEEDERKFLPIKAAYSDVTPHLFNDKLCRKFINIIMYRGEKETSRKVFCLTMEKIKRIQVKKWNKAKTEDEKSEIECNPTNIFKQAVQNVTPMLKLVPVKKGGISYQVPAPISDHEAEFRALQSIRDICREKPKEVKMFDNLAKEILDAFHGEGRAVKKKQELHRQCEANRAFAHYRWS